MKMRVNVLIASAVLLVTAFRCDAFFLKGHGQKSVSVSAKSSGGGGGHNLHNIIGYDCR